MNILNHNFELRRFAHSLLVLRGRFGAYSRSTPVAFPLLVLFCFLMWPALASGQYTTTVCQMTGDGTIGPDRNDFAHNVSLVNEGFLHNFSPPALPCGVVSPSITSLTVSIELLTINTSAGCTGIPIFGNVHRNCSLSPPGVCGNIRDVLTPGCDGYGGGQTTPGTYSLDIAT